MDMDKICRVCLKQVPNLFLIFEEIYINTELNLTIADILTELTIYKVQQNDELPHLICSNCLQSAQSAFSFKRQCEQSYRNLIALISSDDLNTHEETTNSIEKETQTDDSCLYPCERCDEKFFTFYALRQHREKFHKGGEIICRFCSKEFNRIGYLKTHIAIFHPHAGLNSHNECHICKRQFTRREHMRRHLAVIHKIVENVGELVDENEAIKEQTPVLTTNAVESELTYPTQRRNSVIQENTQYIYNKECKNIIQEAVPQSEEDDDGIEISNNDVLSNKSEDEDDKPLSELAGKNSTSGFTEVLLNESFIGSTLAETSADTKEISLDCVNTKLSAEISTDDVLQPIKRGRGRPPRILKGSSLIAHSLKNNTYDCDDCGKKFLHESTMKRHKLDHERFHCKICSNCFTRADYLKDHIDAVHNVAKEWNCKICAKVFMRKSQYQKHLETKHSEKKHKCNLCHKSFATHKFLLRHLSIHSRKRHVCKECSENFESKDELITHIKTEGHDKPLLCPECGLRCKTSTILLVHMRRHTGEKPYKCKFCSKGFPRMDDLRVHERYHTGEKTHFCETCGKGFQRKYNLTIHLRVHTGEKPYKCPHCQQAFAQGNDLKAHIRRHTGERFRCEVCGAAFLQGYQIRQHKLAEHGIKEFPTTQRVAKFTSPQEQEKQIKENLQKELVESISNNSVFCAKLDAISDN